MVLRLFDGFSLPRFPPYLRLLNSKHSQVRKSDYSIHYHPTNDHGPSLRAIASQHIDVHTEDRSEEAERNEDESRLSESFDTLILGKTCPGKLDAQS